MIKVFIPQIPTRYDAATRKRVPSLDLNPAAEWGRLVNLIDTELLEPDMAAAIIKEKAQEISGDDYILAVGDVALLTITVLHAAIKNGKVKILRWDKRAQEYHELEVEI